LHMPGPDCSIPEIAWRENWDKQVHSWTAIVYHHRLLRHMSGAAFVVSCYYCTCAFGGVSKDARLAAFSTSCARKAVLGKDRRPAVCRLQKEGRPMSTDLHTALTFAKPQSTVGLQSSGRLVDPRSSADVQERSCVALNRTGACLIP